MKRHFIKKKIYSLHPSNDESLNASPLRWKQDEDAHSQAISIRRCIGGLNQCNRQEEEIKGRLILKKEQIWLYMQMLTPRIYNKDNIQKSFIFLYTTN